MRLARLSAPLLAALAAFLLGGALARAAEPEWQPIPQVEAGVHTAGISQIVLDAKRERFISVSEDKTIRIWQLPEVRLVRAIRVPLAPGFEGRLYTATLSPDGRTLAVSGYTGWEWDRQGSVYLFDPDSGALTRRIGGFPDLAGALAFSPDGATLAVGLDGAHGLRLLDARTYRVLAEDREFGERVVDLEFSRGGLLAVATFDGSVRLYDKTLKLLARQNVKISRQISGVGFSPDGTLLAIGFADLPVIAVVSVPEFRLITALDLRSIPEQRSLCCFTWSLDGRQLFAGGNYVGAGASPIYRWETKTFGAPLAIPLARQRIANLYALAGGSVLFSTYDPSLGVLSTDGRILRHVESALPDFRDGAAAFKASADGNEVIVPLGRSGASPVAFSAAQLGLARDAGGAQHAPAARASQRFRLESWQQSTAPVLNGRKVALDSYEEAHSYAVAPDDALLLLGTEWALRVYSPEGRVLWRTPLPGAAHNTLVTRDGRLAIATLSDGTVRWYRMEDGAEVLALFVHRNGEDWVAWRPDGYYASSEHGDRLIGWAVNRGKDQSPDFVRAVQFERIFYRPDLIRAQLAPAPRMRAAGGPEFSLARFAEVAPPRIAIRQPADAWDPKRVATETTIEITAEALSVPMEELTVFVNDIPRTPARERKLAAGERSRFTRTIRLDLAERDSTIRVEVRTPVALGLGEAWARGPERAAARAGRLHVLAVGVNEFKLATGAKRASIPELSYAARDAREFARLLADRGAKTFESVTVRVLSDLDPTPPERAHILSALGALKEAGPNDTVVVFLASHGVSDQRGNYFFVPRDARPDEVQDLVHGRNNTGRVPSLVSWQEIFDGLGEASGRRILIVDTCHAANASGVVDTHSLRKRSAASLFGFLAAAKGSEISQEYEKGQHGLFTFGLIEALRGADARKQSVTLDQAFDHAARVVETLRVRRVGPQTPQMIAPDSIKRTVLVGAGR
jgi:hypothetical protein